MSRDLLFEIGVEELPSSYVPPALDQLERAVRAGLQELRLSFDDVTSYGTPRRLTVLVTDVAERQNDFEEEAMGPATKAAFDAEGKPTKALVGFCAGKGVDVSAVRRVETPKGEYVAVTVKHVGKGAAEVLPGLLGGIAPKIQFPKTMRWDAGDYRFGRPVRWLVALFCDAVLPVQAFGLTAGRASFGHRFLHPGTVDIPSPRKYVEVLKGASVLADHRVREIAVREEINKVAAAQGGRVVADDELVEINNFLVEWPTGIPGEFAAQYLDLPREVIVTALREHQRFHATEKSDGTATLTGTIYRASHPTWLFDANVTFSGRVDPGAYGYAPAGSPKRELAPNAYVELGGPVDTNAWRYYQATSGRLTGAGALSGALIDLSRMGPAFQVGVGANGKNVKHGASGWLDVRVKTQPTTGICLPWCGLQGDINIDTAECP